MKPTYLTTWLWLMAANAVAAALLPANLSVYAMAIEVDAAPNPSDSTAVGEGPSDQPEGAAQDDAAEQQTDSESAEAHGAETPESEPGDDVGGPEQAMQGFKKPEDWGVSLFAAEPDLQNPVAFHVDNQGRVWVCETFRQDQGVTDNRGHDRQWLLADLAAQSVEDRIAYHRRLLGDKVEKYTRYEDRIRLLTDADGDRVANKSIVFADGFDRLEEGTGAGVLFHAGSVYYTCIPNLWKLDDSDGDGRVDSREVLHSGYGVRVAFRGHDLHGLVPGPDGRLYFSIGDRGYNVMTEDGRLKDAESGAVFRCELDGSNLEAFATGLRNPQELAFDDYGYLFTGDNNSDSGDKARWVYVMEGGDSGWRMMYQYMPDRGPFNREKIWEPYSEETPAYIVPPVANIGDGPSGLTCYPGTGLDGDYDNCFFLVDFRGGAANSGVRLIRSVPDGAFWKIERSEQPIWNVLATDVQFGPDGALWVSDWVNGWTGEGKGRIYRFFDTRVQESSLVAEVEALLRTDFNDLAPARLGELLEHPDRRVRLQSQWELARRRETAEFKTLLADEAGDTIPRLHAVWGIGHAARLQRDLIPEVVEPLKSAIESLDREVRAAAIEVAGDLQINELGSMVVERIEDPEARVRYAACLASGKFETLAALQPTLRMLVENDAQDPALRHAGIMALSGLEDATALLELQSHSSTVVRRAAVIALRKRLDPRVAEFLDDQSPEVRLEAARAVHDVPELHAGLPRLAACIDRPADDPAWLHRVLNANFRIGSTAALQAIADFAANRARDESMRIEAVRMLGAWPEPSKLDRVMNRYMPLQPRKAEPVAIVIEQRLAWLLGGSPKLVSETIEVASQFGISQAEESLRQLVDDDSQPVKLRVDALRGLVNLEAESVATVVERTLALDVPALRAAAIRLTPRLDADLAMQAIELGLEADAVTVQQAAWDALGDLRPEDSELQQLQQELLDQGVRRYIRAEIPPAVWLNLVEAAQRQASDETLSRLDDFRQRLIAESPLEEYREAIDGGDPEAGERLFFTRTELSCVRCHRVDGVGGEVGPNLSQISKDNDNRFLLESIVLPDAKIAENFETLVILTDDDQVLSGILRKETSSSIELIDAEGNLLSIAPERIVARRTGKSSMPADLVKLMSKRELRDLVAYLATLEQLSEPEGGQGQ